MSNPKAHRVRNHACLVLTGLSLLCGGCTGAILDAAAAGALDLIHGTVAGFGGSALFGESPSPLIFNSILNAIGGGGGGGGGGGHH